MFKETLKNLIPISVWSRLRAWKSSMRLRRFQKRLIDVSFSGVRIKLLVADPLGRAWYSQGCSELPEIAFLRRNGLREGATVFDIGAHQCVVALALSFHAGRTGRVFAVEPNANNVEIGRVNRQLNDASNLQIIHAAAGAKSGTVKVTDDSNAQIEADQGRYGSVEVECVTADGLAERFGYPDVVCIDVEGYESEVLQGAAHLVSRGAVFFVELHVGCGLEKLGYSAQDVFAHFPRDRYELFVSENVEDEPVQWKGKLPMGRSFLFAVPKQNDSKRGDASNAATE